jgi:hypothetical protein
MYKPDDCRVPAAHTLPRHPGLTAALLATALVLHACGTAPRGGASSPAPTAPAGNPTPASSSAPATAGSPATPAPAPAPAQPTLATERQWLQSWFAGTPVQITQRGDGPLLVSVPREFCFDRGRSNLKPALAAVLDKVAESLRRVPQARLQLLAAPGDAGAAAGAPLTAQRGAQLRARLLSRGVQVAQLTDVSAAAEAAVQLQLVLNTP